MEKFYFTNNIETIIDLFNFKRVPQLKYEDKVYKLYELRIVGFESQRYKIEITIEHHPEEEDKVYFELISNLYGTGHHIRIDIQSVVELTMFIKTITS